MLPCRLGFCVSCLDKLALFSGNRRFWGRLAGNIIGGLIGGVVGGFLFMFLAIAAGDLIGSIVTDAMGAVILLLLFGLFKKAKKI
ncbi:MAG: GlsB/YeaQ/YmgE family stress response membrane protein [Desulfurivibrio sp.]|nr:GlsB/YeaQ/YmgE family stress response membrane protein [Desulfurivibrio sp.]MBU4119333.1 GlsB/YeaQ/YmgE family stress response membrane protein [Pseudomonadota bacterium]